MVDVTVIVPVFNRQSMVIEALNSIAAQTCLPRNVVVVDDGSTDRTEEVACELSQPFPQVQVARHPHPRGVAASVFTGLAQTPGQFILLQNIDEPLRPRVLRQFWELRNDEKLVIAHPINYEPNSVLNRLVIWDRADNFSHVIGPDGMRMFRREALESVKRFDRADISTALPVVAPNLDVATPGVSSARRT